MEGQAAAINLGWQRSRGEILAWLNSDDIYEAGAVLAAVEAFQRHPEVDVVTGDCQVIDEAGCFVKRLPSGKFDIQAILSGNRCPSKGSSADARPWPQWAGWTRAWTVSLTGRCG